MLLNATVLAHSYGARPILRDCSLGVNRGDHLGLVGAIGSGMSTLLRLLLGLEEPDAGRVIRAPILRVGYLPQDPVLATPESTTLDVYREGLAGEESELIAGLIGQGNFRIEDIYKPVEQLSIGQRRRLEIARLIHLRPNVLVLDEPMKHLSPDVLEGFESAVLAYPGPVLAVSHDRWFTRRFGGQVYALETGRLRLLSPEERLGDENGQSAGADHASSSGSPGQMKQ